MAAADGGAAAVVSGAAHVALPGRQALQSRRGNSSIYKPTYQVLLSNI